MNNTAFIFGNKELLYRMYCDKPIFLTFDLWKNDYALQYSGITMWGLYDNPSDKEINRIINDLLECNILEKK